MDVITSQVPVQPVAKSEPVKPVGPQQRQDSAEKERTRQREAINIHEMEKLVAMIQRNLDSMNINISFSTYGSERERVAIVVKEKTTGNVVREIPPKELQNLHMKMEELLGMIFNDRA